LIDRLGCRRIELENGRLKPPRDDDEGIDDEPFVPQGEHDRWQ